MTAKATPRPRAMKPREPIAAAALHVSQLNCLPLLGLDPRRFLDLLLAHPDVPRAVVGKLRLVAVDDVRALLGRLATAGGSAEAPAPEATDEPDALGSPDEILARLGLRRVG